MPPRLPPVNESWRGTGDSEPPLGLAPPKEEASKGAAGGGADPDGEPPKPEGEPPKKEVLSVKEAACSSGIVGIGLAAEGRETVKQAGEVSIRQQLWPTQTASNCTAKAKR